MNFQPKKSNFAQDVNFPNPHQKSKVSFPKGKNNTKNFNNWLDNKGNRYQSRLFFEKQIKDAYETYLWESSQGSTSSQEILSKP